MRVKNSLNAASFPKNYEVNEFPSETIPDQTMSMREILQRYARGLPLEGERVPMYSEDPENDLPDMRHLDLAEQQEIREQYAEELKDLEKRLKKQKDSKSKAGKQGAGEAEPKVTGEGQPGNSGEGTKQAKAGAEQPEPPANL